MKCRPSSSALKLKLPQASASAPPSAKHSTMTRMDPATALRAQARSRRARVLGYSPAISRVDAAKLQKTRLQQYRNRLQSTAVPAVSAQRYAYLADGLPISLAKPALWEVDPCALAEAGLDPEMAKISGPSMRRLLQPLSAQYVPHAVHCHQDFY